MSYTSKHRRRWDPTVTLAVAGSACPQTTWPHASRGAAYAWSPVGMLARFHTEERLPAADLADASRIIDTLEGVERA